MEHHHLHDHSCTCGRTTPRRDFLKLAMAGAGAGLIGTLGYAPRARAGHTEALLLSCMDYRLVDETERYMSGRGLRDKYDHVILAGASLGAQTEKFPSWGKTFWEHLSVAIDLHKIHHVYVMDHRDCGAYKVILGEDLAKDRAKETATHTAQLKALRDQIKKKYPELEVELLLIDLDGKVETVEAAKA